MATFCGHSRDAGATAVLVMLVVLAGAVVGSAAGSTGFAPTPTSPVFGGVSGALPPGFTYVYDDAAAPGWPVAPRREQHPVRGSFLDPRGRDDDGLSGYHFGVDVNVDDERPDPGAPAGLSHRVYALESGVAREPLNVGARGCLSRRLDVGHFSYWHASPVVRPGTRVRAGQQIAWTCRGVWHVHVSEWQRYGGARIWVNPLHRGGRLAPYADTAPPVVTALAFFTPPARPWLPTVSLVRPDTSTRLLRTALHGPVELRAQIGDPQSFLGFLTRNAAWPTAFTPYRVTVQIRAKSSGRTVMRRVSFQGDQLPQTPYLVHYAPGTVEADNMQECVGPPALTRCAGSYWFRPFSRFSQEFWDTGAVPDGSYVVTVRAYDLAGNAGSKTVTVAVKNRKA